MTLKLELKGHSPRGLGELASEIPLKPSFQFWGWYGAQQVVGEDREFSSICSVTQCLCFNSCRESVITHLAKY